MKMEGQMPATSISKKFQGGGWEGKEETESLRKSRAVDGLEDLVKQRAAMVEAADPDGHVDVLRIQCLK